jgi:hypothetical protein
MIATISPVEIALEYHRKYGSHRRLFYLSRYGAVEKSYSGDDG